MELATGVETVLFFESGYSIKVFECCSTDLLCQCHPVTNSNYCCNFFQSVVGLSQYPQFLGDAMRIFLKILQESDPSFIGENNTQVINQLILTRVIQVLMKIVPLCTYGL